MSLGLGTTYVLHIVCHAKAPMKRTSLLSSLCLLQEQNTFWAKPDMAGLLTAIRGTSRFCSACGQHMGWAEDSRKKAKKEQGRY